MRDIKILICNVKTARISYLAVNDSDLPVVTVVNESREERYRSVENIAPDPFG